MQTNEAEPEKIYLLHFQGFYFCDLLLSIGRDQEVITRVNQMAEEMQKSKEAISRALLNLLQGLIGIFQFQRNEADNLSQSAMYLHQAVAYLREYNSQQHLPRGLIARAKLYRIIGQFSNAWTDIEEVRDIAERGSMGLYLVDYHIEGCHLHIEEKKKKEASQYFETAKSMIDDMGYHRRDKEINELENMLI